MRLVDAPLDPQLTLFRDLAKPADWETHPMFQEVEPHVFDQFKRFHAENPHIFILFRRYAHEVKSTGRQTYSSKCIMERIRWHCAIETTGEEFKISNSVTSCYGRLLMIQEPSFLGFFRRHREAA